MGGSSARVDKPAGVRKALLSVQTCLYGKANASQSERSRYTVDLRMLLVALLTFLSYAVYHMQRIGFSGLKPSMKLHAGFSKPRLGTMDMSYLFAYAIGQFICGRAADIVSPKRALVYGMMICAAFAAIEGFMGAGGVRGDGAGYAIWLAIRTAEGLAQATGWTSTVAIMGNWFPEDSRGLVLGVWAANANVGDIAGLQIGSFMLGSGMPWYAALWVFGLLGLGMALVNMVCLRQAPHVRSLDWQVEAEDKEGNPTLSDDPDVARPRDDSELGENTPVASLQQVLCIPGLLQYAFSYMFLKLVNYALFLWLPLYLKDGANLKEAAADAMAANFDYGFILGGVLAGLLSDWSTHWARIPFRSPVVSVFLLLSIVPLSVLHSTESVAVISWAIFLSGVLQGGPAEALTSSVSVDLGTHPSLNGARATSTCTGVIDGIGALGAAVGQFLIGEISEMFGWKAVFVLLIVNLACSFALSLLRLRVELSEARAARRRAAIEEAADAEGRESSESSETD